MANLATEPLSSIVTKLTTRFTITHMVETGTSHKAKSALWGAQNFKRVTTVEILPDYVNAARKLLSPYTNVDCRLGDSAKMLRELAPTLNEPTFFWLDAHRGGGYHGTDDLCPLLDELEAIALSAEEHIIFIDDANGFLAPLPPPFNHTAWPSLTEVIEAVTSRHHMHCIIFTNVIMCVPGHMRALLDAEVIGHQKHGAMIYKGMARTPKTDDQ